MCAFSGVAAPLTVERFLNLVLKIFKCKLGFLPASIILFGSAVKGGFNDRVSDVDLLIVLDDGVGGGVRRAALSLMFSVQRFFFKLDYSSFLDRLLYFFEAGTGLFKSFFICFERDLFSKCFHRVFNVNRFLSCFIAPGRLVLNSVFSNCRVLYGRSYDFKQFNAGLNFFQIVKSFILCSLLFFFSIIVNCFKPAWRYFYTSVKWSLLNCYFYLTGRSVDAKTALSFFKKFLDVSFLRGFLLPDFKGFYFNARVFFKLFQLIFNLHFKAPRLVLSNLS